MTKLKKNIGFFILIFFSLLGVLALSIRGPLFSREHNIKNTAASKENNTVQISSTPNNVEFLSSDTHIQSQLKYYNKPFVENICFNFDDKPVLLKYPVYVYSNRYYLPIANFLDDIKGSMKQNKYYIYLEFNNNTAEIDTRKDMIILKDKTTSMRNPLETINGVSYISLVDITDLFDMTTYWNYDSKTISLYIDNHDLKEQKISLAGRPALIRLEDISVGQDFGSATALEKLRIIGDYLYSEEIPFHIAWVPRYTYPLYNIDNDLSTEYSMYNADFIYTLDYLMSRGAMIGLHDYTHQNGNQQSIVAPEFSSKYNNTEADIRDRLTAALKCAKNLNIPIGFFETPHYLATRYQHSIMEQYFNYLYEPFDSNHQKNIYMHKVGKRIVKYIPTPCEYVHGATDTDNMIKKINELPKNELESFFFHPNIDFPYITLVKREGTDYPDYVYSTDSPLHKIIYASKKASLKFVNITSIKVPAKKVKKL